MASYTNAFALVNTMGCHIVAPLVSIAYFYFKYKRIERHSNDEKKDVVPPKAVTKSKIGSFLDGLNEGKFWHWSSVFFTGIAVFGGLSAVSQRWVTSTPVYYVVPDWHNGVEVTKSVIFCAGLLGFALLNLYLMQNRKRKSVKGLIFLTIFTAMGLTLFYGFAVQCAGLNWGSLELSNWKLFATLGASFSVSLFISAVVVWKVLPKVEEYIFPKFFKPSSSAPMLDDNNNDPSQNIEDDKNDRTQQNQSLLT